MKFDIPKIKRDTLGGLLLHLLLAFSSLGIVGLLFFYVYLPAATNRGPGLTVPDVEGLPVSQLDELLEKRTLRYEVSDSAYSSEYPPHAVLRQYPPAGSKVKTGRMILVSVNRVSPPMVPLPDHLIDRSVVNADALLNSNDLKSGRIEYVSGPFRGMVKEVKFRGHTLTAGERVPKGSTIDLVVMDGEGELPEGPEPIDSDSASVENE